jgi:transcription elongation factor GreB
MAIEEKSNINYITPSGLQKLKDELKELIQVERPKVVASVAWAASNGDRSENADYIYGKRRLREIDRRSGILTKKIEEAQVVDPAKQKSEKIVFGATVVVIDEDGEKRTFQIVGADESNVESGRISWQSPVAKALFGKRPGDEVVIRRPAGEWVVEIESVHYK